MCALLIVLLVWKRCKRAQELATAYPASSPRSTDTVVVVAPLHRPQQAHLNSDAAFDNMSTLWMSGTQVGSENGPNRIVSLYPPVPSRASVDDGVERVSVSDVGLSRELMVFRSLNNTPVPTSNEGEEKEEHCPSPDILTERIEGDRSCEPTSIVDLDDRPGAESCNASVSGVDESSDVTAMSQGASKARASPRRRLVFSPRFRRAPGDPQLTFGFSKADRKRLQDMTRAEMRAAMAAGMPTGVGVSITGHVNGMSHWRPKPKVSAGATSGRGTPMWALHPGAIPSPMMTTPRVTVVASVAVPPPPPPLPTSQTLVLEPVTPAPLDVTPGEDRNSEEDSSDSTPDVV